MIDHVGITTRQFETMLDFYQAALAPLGYGKLAEYEGVAGLGREVADFWISRHEQGGGPVHLALATTKRGEVDAFYLAALGAGGRDNGAPGLRPHYSPTYYAAFVIDPDGNNFEVVCREG